MPEHLPALIPPLSSSILPALLQVTPWNVERLRQLVMNGPEQHPGAVAVEDEKGRVVVLAQLDKQRRGALSKQLLADFTGEGQAGAGAAGDEDTGGDDEDDGAAGGDEDAGAAGAAGGDEDAVLDCSTVLLRMEVLM
jgi:hypothetical protein